MRVIGGGIDAGGIGIDGEHLVAAAEIVLAKGHPGQLLARAEDAAQPQRAFGREEIAMLPACLDAHAFLGAIADRARDRPQLGAFERDVHCHHAGFVTLRRRHFARFDADGRYQPRSGHRAAQVEGEAALIDIARIEPCDAGEMAAGEERLVAADDFAEDIFAVRADRHGQVALDPFMVDQQFGVVDLGKGVTGLAQSAIEIEPFGKDIVGLEIIARADFESVAQSAGIGRRGQIAQRNRAIGVARPRNDIEPHARALVGRLLARIARGDGADDLAIVIAIDAQQRAQQFLVLARACGKLGDILVAIIEFLDGRKRLEPVDEIPALAERRFLLREAQHQRIRQFFQIRFVESDLRHIGQQVGKDDIGFGFEWLERFENDIFRPCHRHARNFRNRGLGPEVARGVFHRNLGRRVSALLRPGLGIANRAVGDQVFERRRSIRILRRERLDARDRNRGETGSQRVTRQVSRQSGTRPRARPWPAALRRGGWCAGR